MLWLRRLLILVPLAASAHPLDPLTKDEIAATVGLLRSTQHASANSRFPLLVLQEPPKQDVLAGRQTPRRAIAVVFERASQRTFEAVVDLTARKVISWNEVKGVQSPILLEDFALCEQIVRADPGWQDALRKRGITDLTKVQVDAWGSGYHGMAGEELRRSVRAVSYYRGNEKSAYFHPIEGLVAWVDLSAKKVRSLTDTGALPLAKPPVLTGNKQAALTPLTIVQKEGPSFVKKGSEVEWDRWRFRFALHPREGLVLYTVGYLDNGLVRPVLYRAALSEMVVPYGDGGPAWYFRNAFDISEYAFTGRSIMPLIAGKDTPDNATLYDAVYADESGQPYQSRQAAALYERDGGILWRYSDVDHGATVSRRARELVLATVISAPPYEYGFNWIFHQDGRLEMEVLLTGIMTTKGIVPGGAHAESHGHLVAPDLEAVHHQHFFNFRLDMDVDGPGNSLVEMNTQPAVPDPKDPYGKSITTIETPFRSEAQVKRMVNPATNRVWKVINPSRKNALGEPVGYMLVPGENSIPYASPESWVRKRAGFLDAQLWATPYDASQQYAAGNYVNQNKGGEGLPQWIQANRSIDNQDLVLWYTMGVTHIPRPEEWPVMPAHRAGFQLAPSGFFRSNPALGREDIASGK